MCDPKHFVWMFIAMGVLNALSSFLDWLAKTIPGTTDDKIIFWVKLFIQAIHKTIDFFTARGKR